MRMFFAMIAATILWVGAAQAAPGDYAANNPTYKEFMHSLGSSCENDVAATPELKDETARNLEALKQSKPRDYKKLRQDWKRRCGLITAKQPVDRQDETAGSEDESDAQASQARATEPGDRQVARISGTDSQQLEQIALRALGPVPQDARAYRGHVTKQVAAPAPGCIEVRQAKADKGKLVRWRCPRGTIQKLGW